MSVKIEGLYPVEDEPSVLLVECAVGLEPSKIPFEEFTQPVEGQPRDNWQVPWMEHFLSADGTELLCEPFGVPADETAPSRIAFFMYDLDPELPVETPCGPVQLPPLSPMPNRLSRIIRFENP